MRQTFICAKRFLVELVRDPALVALTALLPVFFFFLAVVGYSQAPRPRTWTVAMEPAVSAALPGLDAALRAARHPDGRPAFDLVAKGEKADIAIAMGARGNVTTTGDALSVDYAAASSRLEEILDGVDARRSAALPVRLVAGNAAFRNPRSEFEAYVPGMMVFAILLLIPQTAVLVGREVRKGTMERLRLAGLRPSAYLGGIALSQTACALGLGVLLIGLALSFGYPFGSSPVAAVLEALATLILLGFSSIAVGLVLGAFVKTDSSALNSGSTLTMIGVFLSGSFFAMPSPTLVAIGRIGQAGHVDIGLWDLLPATHALRALQRAMLDSGAGMLTPILAMCALSLACFAAAVAFFRRRTFKLA